MRLFSFASARCEAAATEHAALQDAPAQIAARRAAALDALETAEAAHRKTADALVQATTSSTEADRAARAAEAALGAAREDAVRAEGTANQAEQSWTAMADRITERLGAAPALPDPPADLSPEVEEKARRRLERLLKEREEMGPVNLRAEVEASEVEKTIATITAEREELTTAIAKLRGSIGHLNREGRERLNSVFEQIDRNFQALFTRMFGGGRAHLALVYHTGHWEVGLLMTAAAEELRARGYIPFAGFCTDPCDGRSQGTTGMMDSLPYRNDAAQVFRRLIRSLPTRRGVLGVATCDKGLPAMMMALAGSRHLPCVLIPGGVTLPVVNGEDLGTVQTIGARFAHGLLSLDQAAELGCRACGSAGGGSPQQGRA